MNRVSGTSLTLARELLALERAGGRKNAEGAASVGEQTARVCDGLRPVLTAFMGAAGHRSLLTRAVALAKAQDGSLKAVEVLEDGTLSGLGNGSEASGEILVAQLLDLLIVFIGEPLTHQLVRGAWPRLPKGALRSKSKDIL